MKPRARVGGSAIAALAIALGLGVLLGRLPSTPSAPGPQAIREITGSGASEIASLRRDLSLARQERDALARQVEALQQVARTAEADPALADATQQASERPDEPLIFDETWLGEAGFPEAEIERLRERWDQLELDRLYLVDLAKREGWNRSQRYRDRVRELHDQLREELCDDGYDALLYAAGRGNRVIVSDVLASSPAALAGIERGDAIRSYAERRLFDVADLLLTTSDGAVGSPTELRIERGDEEIRLFVPRGPLGVRVRRERRVPDTLRWPLACRSRG